MTDLNFREVSKTNLERCKIWHPSGTDDWSPLEWAGAMCGEAGEAANVAKKLKRMMTGLRQSRNPDGRALVNQLRKEIGDTYLYLDLLAQSMNLDMQDCVTHAFNQVSEREGFPQRLEAETNLLKGTTK